MYDLFVTHSPGNQSDKLACATALWKSKLAGSYCKSVLGAPLPNELKKDNF